MRRIQQNLLNTAYFFVAQSCLTDAIIVILSNHFLMSTHRTGCSFLSFSIILSVRMDATMDAKFSFLLLSPEIVTKKPLFLSE